MQCGQSVQLLNVKSITYPFGLKF